ncbi:MAG: hypothetical protein AB1635_03725 [Acidobacteriota bacterium]
MPTATPPSAPYHGLFRREDAGNGQVVLTRHPASPAMIPDPSTGRLLRVATVESSTRAICPSCATSGHGGYVSFEQDLRLAYACPRCEQLVWLAGA